MVKMASMMLKRISQVSGKMSAGMASSTEESRVQQFQ